MAEVEDKVVGFDCEFVEAPPKWLQTECPVCLLILRDPYQVTCCGKSFCRECIERVKAAQKPCPCCKQETFDDFPNKGLQQPLYGFKVRCSKKEEGCKWSGELGQLDSHLNLNSDTMERELEGCEYAKVKCSFCEDTIARNQLLHHKNELCEKRPFSCEHCNEYESTYEDVINKHGPVCGCHPVHCPNKCGVFPQRKNVDSHINHVCPLTVIECDFSYVGCEVRLPRCETATHLKNDMIKHFSLLAVSHRKQQGDLKQQQEVLNAQQETLKVYLGVNNAQQIEIKGLKKKIKDINTSRQQQIAQKDKEIRALNVEVEKLRKQTKILSSQATMFPVDFHVSSATSYAYKTWTSPHFYSHHEGYRLCVQFYHEASGCYIGLCLTKGEYDDQLEWPVTATVKILNICQQYVSPYRNFNLTINNGQRILEEIVHVERYSSYFLINSIQGLHLFTSGGELHIRIVGVQI